MKRVLNKNRPSMKSTQQCQEDEATSIVAVHRQKRRRLQKSPDKLDVPHKKLKEPNNKQQFLSILQIGDYVWFNGTVVKIMELDHYITNSANISKSHFQDRDAFLINFKKNGINMFVQIEQFVGFDKKLIGNLINKEIKHVQKGSSKDDDDVSTITGCDYIVRFSDATRIKIDGNVNRKQNTSKENVGNARKLQKKKKEAEVVESGKDCEDKKHWQHQRIHYKEESKINDCFTMLPRSQASANIVGTDNNRDGFQVLRIFDIKEEKWYQGTVTMKEIEMTAKMGNTATLRIDTMELNSNDPDFRIFNIYLNGYFCSKYVYYQAQTGTDISALNEKIQHLKHLKHLKKFQIKLEFKNKQSTKNGNNSENKNKEKEKEEKMGLGSEHVETIDITNSDSESEDNKSTDGDLNINININTRPVVKRRTNFRGSANHGGGKGDDSDDSCGSSENSLDGGNSDDDKSDYNNDKKLTKNLNNNVNSIELPTETETDSNDEEEDDDVLILESAQLNNNQNPNKNKDKDKNNKRNNSKEKRKLAARRKRKTNLAVEGNGLCRDHFKIAKEYCQFENKKCGYIKGLKLSSTIRDATYANNMSCFYYRSGKIEVEVEIQPLSSEKYKNLNKNQKPSIKFDLCPISYALSKNEKEKWWYPWKDVMKPKKDDDSNENINISNENSNVNNNIKILKYHGIIPDYTPPHLYFLTAEYSNQDKTIHDIYFGSIFEIRSELSFFNNFSKTLKSDPYCLTFNASQYHKLERRSKDFASNANNIYLHDAIDCNIPDPKSSEKFNNTNNHCMEYGLYCCVCGKIGENKGKNNDGGQQIKCTGGCNTWQHRKCMEKLENLICGLNPQLGINIGKKKIPNEFKEKCFRCLLEQLSIWWHDLYARQKQKKKSKNTNKNNSSSNSNSNTNNNSNSNGNNNGNSSDNESLKFLRQFFDYFMNLLQMLGSSLDYKRKPTTLGKYAESIQSYKTIPLEVLQSMCKNRGYLYKGKSEDELKMILTNPNLRLLTKTPAHIANYMANVCKKKYSNDLAVDKRNNRLKIIDFMAGTGNITEQILYCIDNCHVLSVELDEDRYKCGQEKTDKILENMKSSDKQISVGDGKRIKLEFEEKKQDSNSKSKQSVEWINNDIFDDDFILSEILERKSNNGNAYDFSVVNPAFEYGFKLIMLALMSIVGNRNGFIMVLLPSEFFTTTALRCEKYNILPFRVAEDRHIGYGHYYPEISKGQNKITPDSLYTITWGRKRKYTPPAVYAKALGHCG